MGEHYHQILGLRPYTDPKTGKENFPGPTAFFERKVRAKSVPNVLKNAEKIAQKFKPDERWNLFFTVARCSEKDARAFYDQTTIPIDLDGIDHGKTESYIYTVSSILGVHPDDMGIVSSGNGLQFFIEISQKITEEKYFSESRPHYKALCSQINRGLKEQSLPGECDPAVWDAKRLMRLPYTKNIKKKGGETIEKRCELINSRMVVQSKTIESLGELPIVEEADGIDPKTLKSYPTPDTKGVLEGCSFLRACSDDPASVTEPQWYAALSITARLEGGHEISHEISRQHPGYDPSETDEKIHQALRASGPRTCENINTLWDGCPKCPLFEKQTSPILIRTEENIKTKDTGFHETVVGKDGTPKPGRPAYRDLMKYFVQQVGEPAWDDATPHIYYLWNSKFWEVRQTSELDAFAEKHFKPDCTNQKSSEFRQKVKRAYFRKIKQRPRMVNFENGTFDIDKNKLVPHDGDYGFKHVLNYSYNHEASAPRFDKFLDDITCGDGDLKEQLLEAAGYAISGDEPWLQKAFLLIGDGANGKSTFLKVIQELFPAEARSAVSPRQFPDPKDRYPLKDSLINISEEMPKKSLLDSSDFKLLVTGDETTFRQIYGYPETTHTRAKFFFTANELPRLSDLSHGLLRRLVVLPFEARFDESNKDPYLANKLMHERPGIFNMCLSAYRRLCERQELTKSDRAEAAKREFEEFQDHMGEFLEDGCTVHEQCETKLDDLYGAYKNFCRERGYTFKAYNNFARELKKKHGFDTQKKRVNDERARFVQGVKAKPERQGQVYDFPGNF